MSSSLPNLTSNAITQSSCFRAMTRRDSEQEGKQSGRNDAQPTCSSSSTSTSITIPYRCHCQHLSIHLLLTNGTHIFRTSSVAPHFIYRIAARHCSTFIQTCVWNVSSYLCAAVRLLFCCFCDSEWSFEVLQLIWFALTEGKGARQQQLLISCVRQY